MDQIQPKNYLVESILVTICCCLPLGIVSIVFASQVNSKFTSGDYEGAQKASKDAKNWMTWGLIAGIVVNVGFWIIYGSIMLAYLGDIY
jgi:hypothetical protein